MFKNYQRLYPEKLAEVTSQGTAVSYIVEMLESFGVVSGLMFDPDHEAPRQQEEDDLFRYYRELVIRFLPSLVLDMCEAEGDAEGLLACEKLMITYFLGSNLKTQNVKYADYTLFDIVEFVRSSERTKQRMMDNPVINVSGTKGGGQFYDKRCEVVVRQLKAPLRKQHGALDDILLEKDTGGLTIMASVSSHQRMSLLQERIGKERSHDYVKDHVRDILSEQIEKLDPFSRSREVVEFRQSVRGAPCTGLTRRRIEQFMRRKRREWNLKH